MSDSSSKEIPQVSLLVSRLTQQRRTYLSYVTARSGLDAEDILQDASLKAFQNLNRLRDEQRMDAWFYRILDHTIADHGRRHSRSRLQTLADLQSLPNQTKQEDPTCKCGTHLLQELKPEYAEALRRVLLDNEEVSRVATDLGVSRGNLWVRLHRARAALRKKLESHCDFAPNSLHCSCACGVPGGCCV